MIDSSPPRAYPLGMELIDTHCHLCHGRLRQSADEALQRARDAGLSAVICAASDLPESKAALGMARRHPDVHCMAGVHPHDAKDVNEQTLGQIADLANMPENIAVGEIGLDYHYDFSPRNVQRQVFAAQLELARRLDRKVVIHTREALDDTLAVLAESGFDASRAVFHSVTEDAGGVRRMLDTGATISFSGIVTFKKTDSLRDAAALVPDDRLLIETDAPFLSPEPVRKMKTNEPANVAHVCRCLAQVRGTSPEWLAGQTTRNARAFFGLDV
ncbi:MAG: TatD family hydrolase [Phycisphaerae bacterium]